MLNDTEMFLWLSLLHVWYDSFFFVLQKCLMHMWIILFCLHWFLCPLLFKGLNVATLWFIAFKHQIWERNHEHKVSSELAFYSNLIFSSKTFFRQAYNLCVCCVVDILGFLNESSTWTSMSFPVFWSGTFVHLVLSVVIDLALPSAPSHSPSSLFHLVPLHTPLTHFLSHGPPTSQQR